MNGIPLVIIELKNPTNAQANIRTAHSQIYKRYWGDIPAFMRFCALAVVSDGAQTRLGTSTSPFEYFYAWKKVENEDTSGVGLKELDTMIAGALKPERLLEIYRDFVYFPDPAQGEEKELAIVCRYPQFFAARKLKASILKALQAGSNKGGLYFGATGCGKTYTMLFLARLLSQRCQMLGSPTIVLIVDREDLESQAGQLFCNSRQYLSDNNVRVFESRDDLASELKARKSGGFYITTIQKFTESTGLLSNRKNIICMSDEAHRTQNNIGSKLKMTDMGAFVSYGFAKYLRDALPNAIYTGFTGTPIDEAVQVFGGIVDQYTMRQAQRDGITVGICYDPRLARVFLDKAKAEEIEKFYRDCEEGGANAEDVERSKKAMSEMTRILRDPDRLERVGRDIVEDYEKRRDDKPGLLQKAMVTCADRSIAWELYKIIGRLRPEWVKPLKTLDPGAHTAKELEKLKAVPYVNLIATRNEKDDPKELYNLLGDAEHRKELAGVLKDDEAAWSQCFMGVLSFVMKILAPGRGDLERMNRTVEKMVEEALMCTGVETLLGHEEDDDEFIFGEDFMKELEEVDMPNTKFQLLVKLLKRVIRDYAKTNKVRAQYFEKMLEETVEEYNTRDKLTFANEVANDAVNAVSNEVNRHIEELSGKLLELLRGVESDKMAFKKLGITFEEKAFYDILVNLRDTHRFVYPDERCKELAKKIKALVDGTSVYADWLNNYNLRNQLSTDLTTLLYTEGYPPDWDEEVFHKVLEQMENYKRNHADETETASVADDASTGDIFAAIDRNFEG